jgi:hypothetical protein
MALTVPPGEGSGAAAALLLVSVAVRNADPPLTPTSARSPDTASARTDWAIPPDGYHAVAAPVEVSTAAMRTRAVLPTAVKSPPSSTWPRAGSAAIAHTVLLGDGFHAATVAVGAAGVHVESRIARLRVVADVVVTDVNAPPTYTPDPSTTSEYTTLFAFATHDGITCPVAVSTAARWVRLNPPATVNEPPTYNTPVAGSNANACTASVVDVVEPIATAKVGSGSPVAVDTLARRVAVRPSTVRNEPPMYVHSPATTDARTVPTDWNGRPRLFGTPPIVTAAGTSGTKTNAEPARISNAVRTRATRSSTRTARPGRRRRRLLSDLARSSWACSPMWVRSRSGFARCTAPSGDRTPRPGSERPLTILVQS